MENGVYTIEKIKELTKPIFEQYGIDKAYLFGSYARGDCNNKSDIDIIIRAKNIRSLLIIGAMLEELKVVLKKDVDLIEEECFENDIVDDLDKIFYRNIEKERVVIYG